jgi:hypothetical protein
MRKWEDWEVDLIKTNQYLSSDELSERVLPHRSSLAIKDRRTREGLPQMITCDSCGDVFVKNSQHRVCSACKKDHHYHNHSMLGKFRSYKHGANRRGYEWNLSVEEFALYWNTPCDYCNDEIEGVGIDRVDNTKGYSTDNCVPCCAMCNEMKLDYKADAWVSHMSKILNNLGEIK